MFLELEKLREWGKVNTLRYSRSGQVACGVCVCVRVSCGGVDPESKIGNRK